MFVLGLTGSIGMGKSTTASLFREAGVPVHDSDAAVHRLYAGDGARLIEVEFPGVIRDNMVDRKILSARVLGDAAAMFRLEAVVHPWVGKDRDAFLVDAQSQGKSIVVLDIPLLFEIDGENLVDAIVVVTAPRPIQIERVLARPGMTTERLELILEKQLPDDEKRARAHFLIFTDRGIASARRQVAGVLRAISHAQASRAIHRP
jgi:dephospho-CoA kinase